MAGHLHWAGIKHKKNRVDKLKSKIFSKLSREITVAAKLGDKDPDINHRLRAAIQAAKNANMPKDNISRAVEKSQNVNGINFEQIRYEGFGPGNIACIVETLTDNKNRTASNLRTIFQKSGGFLASQGSASHYFKNKGLIKIDKSEIDENSIYEYAVDLGIDDFFSLKSCYEIHCSKNNLYNIKRNLEHKVKNFLVCEIAWIPNNLITLEKKNSQNFVEFINQLEDDDDIQRFYVNTEFEF